jgi:diaminopimelate epimerase
MGLTKLRFTKMHGTGNDFVVVEAKDIPAGRDYAALSQKLSHRRFGIGSDGLLIIGPGREGADLEMIFHNPDGSLAEMCGNGLRCVAKYARDRGLIDRDGFSFMTGSGIKPVTVTRGAEGTVYAVECDMGVPEFAPEKIPVSLNGTTAPILDEPLNVKHGDHDHPIRFGAVSLGNPHAVLVVEDVDTLKLTHLGPPIETHPIFPAKTNVEFAQLLSSDRVKIRIWERGAGETWSCGTGICAVFAVLHRRGLCDAHLTVEVKGGEVETRFNAAGSVLMKGPAVEVFAGEILV